MLPERCFYNRCSLIPSYPMLYIHDRFKCICLHLANKRACDRIEKSIFQSYQQKSSEEEVHENTQIKNHSGVFCLMLSALTGKLLKSSLYHNNLLLPVIFPMVGQYEIPIPGLLTCGECKCYLTFPIMIYYSFYIFIPFSQHLKK